MKLILWSVLLLALLAACPLAMAEPAEELLPEKISIYLSAAAEGPEVTKVIIQLPAPAKSVSVDNLLVATDSVKRVVEAIYLCDEKGNPVEGESDLVAFELENADSDSSGSSSGSSILSNPLFVRNSMLLSEWAETYQVKLRAMTFKVDGTVYYVNTTQNCIDNRICPDAERFNYRSTYTGVYLNPYTGKEEEQTLYLAAYEPQSLAGGEKNPVIIYLHGQTEGGTDTDITILGTEVSALSKDPIQSYFTAGDQVGAYVLVPQCETYWMDEGDGTNGPGGGVSRYTEILMDAILDYLAHNPDADPDRIYIGGSSNGGYMTINMLVSYPDVFAAAYPLCELYSYYLFERDSHNDYVTSKASLSYGYYRASGFNGALYSFEELFLTQEKIEVLADTPIWFVSSVDDDSSFPELYLLPTYRALLQAGAQNCHLSLFETKGHFVWRQLFQNEVTGVQDPALLIEGEIPTACIAKLSDYEVYPTNEGGGTLTANGYDNIFAWMNAQSR